MEYWKQELYHHGILGQKWGKRNGPPYPLGASDHSASERKAGWRKSLEEKIETRKRDRKNKKRLKKDIKRVYRDRDDSRTGSVIENYRKEVDSNKKIKINNLKEKGLRAASSLAENERQKSIENYDEKRSLVTELASDFFTYQADNIYNATTAELNSISKKYVNKMNDALLDDIGWRNSKEAGRRYLQKYGQDFKINSDGEIVRGFWQVGDFGKPVDREDL